LREDPEEALLDLPGEQRLVFADWNDGPVLLGCQDSRQSRTGQAVLKYPYLVSHPLTPPGHIRQTGPLNELAPNTF
jgi:hypothetical protein